MGIGESFGPSCEKVGGTPLARAFVFPPKIPLGAFCLFIRYPYSHNIPSSEGMTAVIELMDVSDFDLSSVRICK